MGRDVNEDLAPHLTDDLPLDALARAVLLAPLRRLEHRFAAWPEEERTPHVAGIRLTDGVRRWRLPTAEAANRAWPEPG